MVAAGVAECPACGERMPKKGGTLKALFVVLLLLIILGGGGFYAVARWKDDLLPSALQPYREKLIEWGLIPAAGSGSSGGTEEAAGGEEQAAAE
jgi:hypothetical protein